VYSSSLSFSTSSFVEGRPPATKEEDFLEHTEATERLQRNLFIGE
jgi:hypothetical protein